MWFNMLSYLELFYVGSKLNQHEQFQHFIQPRCCCLLIRVPNELLTQKNVFMNFSINGSITVQEQTQNFFFALHQFKRFQLKQRQKNLSLLAIIFLMANQRFPLILIRRQATSNTLYRLYTLFPTGTDVKRFFFFLRKKK